MSLSENRVVRLRDGRALAYAEYGDAAGRPVLYFHGFPGSRIEARLAAGSASELGIRLLAIDRPGVGGSTFEPGRRLIEWPDDVRELAGHLGLDRFALLGASGGGPYALACARVLGDRLNSVTVASGLGPVAGWSTTAGMLTWNRFALGMARLVPRCSRGWMSVVRAVIFRWPEQFFDHLLHRVDAADRTFLRTPAVRDTLIESLHTALRQGTQGAAQELALYTRSWGFALDEIPMPVRLWHGGSDRIIPVRVGHELARQLPGARLRCVAGEGHFSLILGRARDILGDLIASPA